MSIRQYSQGMRHLFDEVRGGKPMDTETRRDILCDLFPSGQDIVPHLQRFHALMALAVAIATLGMWTTPRPW